MTAPDFIDMDMVRRVEQVAESILQYKALWGEIYGHVYAPFLSPAHAFSNDLLTVIGFVRAANRALRDQVERASLEPMPHVIVIERPKP